MAMTDMTEWRFLREDYGTRYLFSNDGEVMSLDYAGTGQPGYLAQCGTGSEYRKVHLKDLWGKVKRVTVHRVIAKAFVPNPNKYKYVKHINHNLKDNRASNLEWVPFA